MSTSSSVYTDRKRLAQRIEDDRRAIAEMRECVRQQQELVARVQRSLALLDQALRRRGLVP